MLLNMERCVFCDAQNLFYQPGSPIDDALLSEIMNDMLLLESAESEQIAPARPHWSIPYQPLANAEADVPCDEDAVPQKLRVS